MLLWIEYFGTASKSRITVHHVIVNHCFMSLYVTRITVNGI